VGKREPPQDKTDLLAGLIELLRGPESGFRVSSIIEFLKQALEDGAPEKRWLTVYVQDLIFELGILSQCQTVLGQSRPRSSTIDVRIQSKLAIARDWAEIPRCGCEDGESIR
jgi:hypothetical protein